jgi:hypothetical protein
MEVTFIPPTPFPSLVSSPGLAIQVRTKETEMDREKGKEKPCTSHIVSSFSILSDSHGPRTTNIKSIGNLNGMWPMIGAIFCPDLLVSCLKTKPLSLPKHATNCFLLSCFWGGQFSHCRCVKTRKQIRSYPGQSRWWPWAGPFALLAKTPCSWNDGPTISASCEHRLEKPMTEFQFSV